MIHIIIVWDGFTSALTQHKGGGAEVTMDRAEISLLKGHGKKAISSSKNSWEPKIRYVGVWEGVENADRTSIMEGK